MSLAPRTHPMIIDAHLHIWDLDRARYDWLGGELAPIDRTVSIDEVKPDLERAGVDAVVLVQAADNDEDSQHMLTVADAHPEVRGVVVWVPLDDPDGTERRLSALHDDPRVIGVRSLIHNRQDPDWILRPEVRAGLDVVARAGLSLDYVTADPAALAQLPVLAERHPELRIVLDHLGKPPIGGDLGPWRRLLDAAAENPLLTAKLSGLYPATTEELRPIFAAALELFGARRLMFGGDWPISLMFGGYQQYWAAISPLIDTLGPDRAAVLAGTARRVYHLPELEERPWN